MKQALQHLERYYTHLALAREAEIEVAIDEIASAILAEAGEDRDYREIRQVVRMTVRRWQIQQLDDYIIWEEP